MGQEQASGRLPASVLSAIPARRRGGFRMEFAAQPPFSRCQDMGPVAALRETDVLIEQLRENLRRSYRR